MVLGKLAHSKEKNKTVPYLTQHNLSQRSTDILHKRYLKGKQTYAVKLINKEFRKGNQNNRKGNQNNKRLGSHSKGLNEPRAREGRGRKQGEDPRSVQWERELVQQLTN